MALAEWIDRREYLAMYGGELPDVFDKQSDKPDERGVEILKTAVLSRNRVMVEKIWEAPAEYQDI
jgi:hypothetical protein